MKNNKSEKKKQKRTARTAFDNVADLELEDQAAAKLRRKQSTKDIARAKAARCQTKIYGKLVETRILMQRTLQQITSTTKTRTRGDDDDDGEGEESNDGCEEQCDQLLQQLVAARRKLLHLPDTDDDDQSDNDCDQQLQSEYEICQQGWKDVLNRRHHELRLHSGLSASGKNSTNSSTQFKVLDSSFWQQVESTVAHEEVMRRQQERQQQQQQPQQGDDDDESSPREAEDVFDDSKVYQHMLKDFLLVTASNNSATGNSSSSTYYDAATQQRKKKQQQQQQQVDRKASKGRKIRYVEIPKLVNFTFPVSKGRINNISNTTNNLEEDEWFQSLFGGGHQQQQLE